MMQTTNLPAKYQCACKFATRLWMKPCNDLRCGACIVVIDMRAHHCEPHAIHHKDIGE